MKTKLKICGITNLGDALLAVQYGVDLLGFNFYEKSPRYIPPQNVREIITYLPFTTIPVGILVQPTLKSVLETIERSSVRAVQIIEPQDFDTFHEIPVPVIKVVRMTQQTQPNRFELKGAAMLLLDTYSDGKMGGTGQSFSWDMIPQSLPRNKLILAGGISKDNLLQALQTVQPAIIDVASGSEISPGVKDSQKIQALMSLLQQYNFSKSSMSVETEESFQTEILSQTEMVNSTSFLGM